MYLVIDIGNTRLKAAIYSGSEIVELFIFENTEAFKKDFDFLTKNISHAIVASVANDVKGFAQFVTAKCECIVFTNKTSVPVKNLYQSASTLGSDRLAAAVGAHSLFPMDNVLSIDTGTCIKYNFINEQGEYLGGAISAGLQMRLKALHTFTARLPLVNIENDFNKLIGKNSKDSILSGALMGAIAEVKGIIAEYKTLYPNLKVIVSGGDTDFFAKRLKNSIFARPNLVLEGLHKILEYNVSK